ncbi:MAG TPA: maleylpyruvate isomerase family mycothiol-dependent enzyme [Actinomycetes bacterium]|nr:maleylpyruvate isomerase family mycothiol-dependent enzyme [Actinomycetes bacterium]
MTTEMQTQLAAYADALRDVLAVAESVEADEWTLPTACPGWLVREQVAHVLAVERQLSGQPAPPRLETYPPHVRSPSGEHMEAGIAALRDLAPAELVTGLAGTVELRLAQLEDIDQDPATAVTGTLGTQVPLARFVPIRVLDLWTHEQDLRQAVGRPGGLDGAAARLSHDTMVGFLPHVVSQVGAPAGTTIALEVTGPLAVSVSVSVGADGAPAPVEHLDGPATATVRTDSWTFMRLTAGRVDPAAADVDVDGDPELGARVLKELNISP